jgi:hypothetical protein
LIGERNRQEKAEQQRGNNTRNVRRMTREHASVRAKDRAMGWNWIDAERVT